MIFWSLGACQSTTQLSTAPLPVALLNESYSTVLQVDGGTNGLFDLSGGALPAGVVLSSDGEITGIPTQTGLFTFRVTYFYSYYYNDYNDSYDDYYYYDDSYYDDYYEYSDDDYYYDNSYDDSSYDDYYDYDSDYDDYSNDESYYATRYYNTSKILTLFVTENSTNPNCPGVNSSLGGMYVCGGNLTSTTLSADTALELDVNLFIMNGDQTLQPQSITFSVSFDETLFEPDTNALNSTALLEAATKNSGSTATFDTSTAGKITITVSTPNYFDVAGRFLTLRFISKTEITAGEYEFPIAIDAVTATADGTITLSQITSVNGALTVE